MSEVNYGPPISFKVVDTRTGEESNLNYIDFQDGFFGVGTGNAFEFGSVHQRIFQSTGHHDKNGVEIFFGDVCLIRGLKGYEFNNRKVYISMFRDEICATVPEWDSQTFGHDGLSRYAKNIEVIGNIHTPQDLLDQKINQIWSES